ARSAGVSAVTSSMTSFISVVASLTRGFSSGYFPITIPITVPAFGMLWCFTAFCSAKRRSALLNGSSISIAPADEVVTHMDEKVALLALWEDGYALLAGLHQVPGGILHLRDHTYPAETRDNLLDLGLREPSLELTEIEPLLQRLDMDQGLFPLPDVRCLVLPAYLRGREKVDEVVLDLECHPDTLPKVVEGIGEIRVSPG